MKPPYALGFDAASYLISALLLLYTAAELGGLLAAVAVPMLIRCLAIGPLTAVFLAGSAASVAFLAVAPSYGWALLALFLFGLATSS